MLLHPADTPSIPSLARLRVRDITSFSIFSYWAMPLMNSSNNGTSCRSALRISTFLFILFNLSCQPHASCCRCRCGGDSDSIDCLLISVDVAHILTDFFHEGNQVFALGGSGARADVGREGAEIAAYEHATGSWRLLPLI